MKSVSLILLCCMGLLSACGSGSSDDEAPDVSVDQPRKWLPPGGVATLAFTAEFPFLQFIPSLDILQYPDASRGRELFVAEWEAALGTRPTLDGLGPLAVTSACDNCHLPEGRAPSLLDDGRTGVGILFRLGREDGTVDSHFGVQLQSMATAGLSEGTVNWRMDSDQNKPVFEFLANSYMLDEGINLGPRLSPQLVGVGLLELIPDATILAFADENDDDQDGISGRIHWRDGQIGRFGWKAVLPTLEAQSAAALQQDMGLTNPIFPTENCTEYQSICTTEASGGSPEVSAKSLAAINTFLTLLAVPDRRIADQAVFDRGANLFDHIGCAACHKPSVKTGISETFPFLSNQTIYPYTDLLLHDMGEALSDGVREGDALASEWRTPPLWGLGLIESIDSSRFLHDGRAQTIEQAIGWHGGEALSAREAFDQLEPNERLALLTFLRGI